MEPMRELPTGFGMALLQNTEAANFYQRCTPAQQQAILGQAGMLKSSEEMKAFVANLPSAAL